MLFTPRFIIFGCGNFLAAFRWLFISMLYSPSAVIRSPVKIRDSFKGFPQNSPDRRLQGFLRLNLPVLSVISDLSPSHPVVL